jgi:L-aspartate oxidase
MTEAPQAAPMKPGRVMADGSWLMAMADGRVPSTMAISHQPLAISEIRDLMWLHAGLFRSRDGLTQAVAALESGTSPSPTTVEGWREHNLMTVARLIAAAALRREESRGAHFRSDFPERSDERWKIHLADQGRRGE